MQGILAEVGYADALLARETTDGLQIIDTDDEGAPLTLFGTQEMSSTMRDVVFSSGFSWVLITATWDP